jgi:VWFA-related protein
VKARLSTALVALALGASSLTYAQDEGFEIKKVEKLHLDDVYPSPEGEHNVELYLRALTRYGEPIEKLRSVDLVIRDGDERIDPEDVSLESLSETHRGMTAVIAIDTSRTMKGEPFRRAKAAAIEFLDHLESTDKVAVVAFSDEARTVVGFSASRAAARVEMDGLEVDTDSLSTALHDGVYEAIEIIRSGENLPRRSFVIVFSDGKDAGSNRTLEEVITKSAATEVRPPALIFSIGYARFGGEGLAVLRELSEKTGGDFLQATSTIHLSSFFNEIWRQMMKSYVVRFPSDMDGEDHRVEISLDDVADTKTVRYPDLPTDIRPYLFVAGGVLAVAVIALLLARGRGAGQLVIIAGPRSGDVVAVKGSKLSIGALEDNDVVLVSETVSRYHAAIHRKGRKVEIEDLNSVNGTFVNGIQIRRASSPLRPGDKIRIADVDMEYQR